MKLPHSAEHYSDLASELTAGGVRGLELVEVLETFPDADDIFLRKLDGLMRRKGVVIIDEGAEDTTVASSNAQEQATEAPDATAGESESQKSSAKDFWKNLELPDFVNSVIEEHFRVVLCPDDIQDKLRKENNVRKYKQYALTLRRHLAYAQRKTKLTDEWMLLADLAGCELAREMLKSKLIAPATSLTHAKIIMRVIKLAEEKWENKTGYPQNKPDYKRKLSEASEKWKSIEQAANIENEKATRQRKVAFNKKGTMDVNAFKQYFERQDKLDEILSHINILEQMAKENSNIISLGTGLNYNRVMGHHWNKVVRYLGMSMQVFTKRLSSLQGVKMSEFRDREKRKDGWFLEIANCKNADNSSDGFIIPNFSMPAWERFYNLRLLCRKQGNFDREEMFVNICGQKFTKFTDDLNAEFKNQPHSINGRNIRTSVCTAGKSLDKNKRPDFLSFINHGDGVDRQVYQAATAETIEAGQKSVTHVMNMVDVKSKVLPQIEKICTYEQKAIFPDILTTEDILRESFKINVDKLDEDVYSLLHEEWQKKCLPYITRDLAQMAFVQNEEEFDAMFILQELRKHEEWRALRAQIRDAAESNYKEVRFFRVFLKTYFILQNNRIHTFECKIRK